MGEHAHGARRLMLPAWLGAGAQALAAADIALVLGCLFLIRLSSRLGVWAYALLALPGTLAHELAHYLVALLLFAKPQFPSLIPRRMDHGWRLGSVAFRAGWLRSLPIALAPFALLPLALWWAVSWMAPSVGVAYFAHAWIVAALVSASLPSAADFRIALPALAFLALGVLAYVLIR
jgi:hypothetical protein